jgi:Cu/Ag efflux pump CusA
LGDAVCDDVDWGWYLELSKLSIDAVPDITNTQVQINTQANGYCP